MRAMNFPHVARLGLCSCLVAVAAWIQSIKADPPPSDILDLGGTFENVQIDDESLAKKIEVVRVVAQPNKSGQLLTVSANLHNKTGHRLALEVETIYTDNAGNELNTSSWIPLTLGPYESHSYSSSSISEDATNFKIRIRQVDESAKKSTGSASN